MPRRTPLILGLLLLLLLTACISTSSEPEIVRTRVLVAPTAQPAPATFDLSSGAALYAENCAPCHGEQGLGDGPAASGFDCPMPQFANRGAEPSLAAWFQIVAEGKRSSASCIMPPWSNRLNAQQMWNAAAYAYHLGYGVSPEEGRALLETLQTEDAAAPFLQDSQWQAENSDAALLSLISSNQLPGYDFAALAQESDPALLLAGLRSYVMVGHAEVAAAQPEPLQTAEPGPAEEQALPTAAPSPESTSEAPSPFDLSAVPGATITVRGTITNGSSGGTVPADLRLRLRGVALGENGEPVEIYQGETSPEADQSYAFTDVPAHQAAIALISTEYGGTRQFSPEIFLGAAIDGVIEVPITIYDTTDSAAQIGIAYTEAFVDAVTVENASLIYQSYDFINQGDTLFVPGDDARTLRIDLPTGALAPAVFRVVATGQGANLMPADERFELVREEDHFVFYYRDAVSPGLQERLVLRYNLPYAGSMDLEQRFAYPVEDLSIYVSETRGLELSSDMLVAGSSTTFNGAPYLGFSPVELPLPADSIVRYRVQDGPNTVQPDLGADSSTSSQREEGFFQENANLLLGLGVLLLLGGAMFLFYDLQKTRLLAQGRQDSSSAPTERDQDALAAQIARLDERYEAGEVDEDSYQQQRATLLERLRQWVDG